ncbi:MAG: helix-turn-helix domain-containing protein [Hyphomicrobiales bacterium]|nr:helix-turn-helix domain-containing protein [Hyphomicrobiales bacterium]
MAEEPNLPDQAMFTREELSQEWNCRQSKIDAYIDSGQLKEALPPDAVRDFRRWKFYRCADNEPLLDAVKQANEIDADDNAEWLLDLIEDGEMLEKYVGEASQEKIISCPKHLYIPANESAIIDRRNPNAIKGSKERPDLVRYFYDLHGNALIPIKNEGGGYRICFAPVEKHHLDSLIIRIEEIRRFVRKGKKTSSAIVAPKKETTKQEQEDSKIASPDTNDNVYNTQPPTPDRLIDIKEVRQRTGCANSTIYKKVRDGEFPSFEKRGRSTFWRESVINAYVAGTWEPPVDEDSEQTDE